MVGTGLEKLLSDGVNGLSGKRVGLCCNHTAVDRDFDHAIDRLRGAGVELVRLFAPEHGVRATVQDMIGLDEQRDPVSGLPVVSLYTDNAASLHPDPASLEDLDVVLFDIQDIGTRFYTYQATLGFLMQVAGTVDTKVVVLDRPNPLGGVRIEGNLVQPGYESFVGAFPLAVRHGLTMGELGRFFARHCDVQCELEVVELQGWQRHMWFEETGCPWVFPSPNMPTVDTATVYPGMCLFEGTTLSEGRGTTRPFHLVGAPGLDPVRLTELCRKGADEAGLHGVRFRPAAFLPGFQKHRGQDCTGVEVHVVDRDALDSWLLGMVVLEACYRTDPAAFAWRTETYEFVDDPIAIDLLCGSPELRAAIETRTPLTELQAGWAPQLEAFEERRQEVLIYR